MSSGCYMSAFSVERSAAHEYTNMWYLTYEANNAERLFLDTDPKWLPLPSFTRRKEWTNERKEERKKAPWTDNNKREEASVYEWLEECLKTLTLQTTQPTPNLYPSPVVVHHTTMLKKKSPWINSEIAYKWLSLSSVSFRLFSILPTS